MKSRILKSKIRAWTACALLALPTALLPRPMAPDPAAMPEWPYPTPVPSLPPTPVAFPYMPYPYYPYYQMPGGFQAMPTPVALPLPLEGHEVPTPDFANEPTPLETPYATPYPNPLEAHKVSQSQSASAIPPLPAWYPGASGASPDLSAVPWDQISVLSQKMRACQKTVEDILALHHGNWNQLSRNEKMRCDATLEGWTDLEQKIQILLSAGNNKQGTAGDGQRTP